jgi:hypothetical protein
MSSFSRHQKSVKKLYPDKTDLGAPLASLGQQLKDRLDKRFANNQLQLLEGKKNDLRKADLRKQALRASTLPIVGKRKQEETLPDLYSAASAGAILRNDGSLDPATYFKAIHRSGAQDLAKTWPSNWPKPLTPGTGGATQKPLKPAQATSSFAVQGGSRPPIEDVTRPGLSVLDAGVAGRLADNKGRMVDALQTIKEILSNPKPFPRRP